MLVKCRECGLLYVNPRPEDEEIEQSHQLGMHQGAEMLDVTGRFDWLKVRVYEGVLRDFFYPAEYFDEKHWLDVGCGHGEFLVAMERVGRGRVMVEGVEPNAHKRESARKRGLSVSSSDLAHHEGQYDVVSMLNVYSHLPHPPSMIMGLTRLLRPGGELFLQTGDTASLDSDDHPRPFWLPDHLSFASEEIVVSILERKGFEILDIKKYPFVRLGLGSLTREIAKAILPGKKSHLKCLFRYRLYSQTDMYIRARFTLPDRP